MLKNNGSLRVAMISEHGDPVSPLGGQQSGGQNVYVYELARSLSKAGVFVDVFTRWDNRKADEIVRFAKRAKVVRLKAGPRHFVSKDDFGPLMPEFVERFLEYSREKKVKYDLIHSHYYYSGWVGLRLRNILKIPLIATFHSLGLLKKQALGERDTSPSERTRIEKEIMQKADLIISTSPQEQEDMKQVYKEKKLKSAMIPPGVNLRRFSPLKTDWARRKLDLPNNKKIIVFAGKMERRKGSITLVEAIAKIEKIHPDLYKELLVFLFTGDPRKTRRKEKRELSARDELKSAINNLGKNPPVYLMRGLPQETLHLYYGAADVVAMPSYYEPFGMVAIEAMATGTPVVASDVGGLKWTVKNGETGYRFKPKDSNELASKIVKILTGKKNKEFYFKCMRFARGNFGWQVIARQVVAEYKKLIG